MDTIKNEFWWAVVKKDTQKVIAVFSIKENADDYAIEHDFIEERQPERVRVTILESRQKQNSEKNIQISNERYSQS